jgi:VWFA-related protein
MRIFCSLVCLASLIAGQEPPKPNYAKPGTDDADPVIRTTFKFVLVPVTVTDRDGHFVNGLGPDDFHLTDNGKPQKITEDVTTHPISMVVAIQANHSVVAVLPQIKRLSSVFESLVLGNNGELAVLTFDDRVTTLTDFTSEAAKVDAAFGKLTASSDSSDLHDAAMRGIDLLRDRPSTRRRVLVLIAENGDQGSAAKMRKVLSAGEFASVVVHTVDVSQLLASLASSAQPNRPSPIPPEARQLPAGVIGTPATDAQMEMGNWAPAFKDIFLAAKGVVVSKPLDVYPKYTGGRKFSFDTQRALERDISILGEELHSQYFLTYYPSTEDEAGFHQILVTVDRANLKIRTRDGYFLAGPP